MSDAPVKDILFIRKYPKSFGKNSNLKKRLQSIISSRGVTTHYAGHEITFFFVGCGKEIRNIVQTLAKKEKRHFFEEKILTSTKLIASKEEIYASLAWHDDFVLNVNTNVNIPRASPTATWYKWSIAGFCERYKKRWRLTLSMSCRLLT
jgi:hypothetical protein